MEARSLRLIDDAWNALMQLGLDRRTGRLAVFFGGHGHVFLEINAGVWASISTSERRLYVEQVMLRQGVITPEQLQEAMHVLEFDDFLTKPVASVLIERGVISRETLHAARMRQLQDVFETILSSDLDSLMFVPGPVELQKVESPILIDEVLNAARFALLSNPIENTAGEPALSDITND